MLVNATGLTGDLFVNGAVIRAATAGAFGIGTIHLIDPTIQYGATGTYANNNLGVGKLGATLPLNKNESAELNIYLPAAETFRIAAFAGAVTLAAHQRAADEKRQKKAERRRQDAVVSQSAVLQ